MFCSALYKVLIMHVLTLVMSSLRCSLRLLMDRLKWRSRFVRESERWLQTTRFWDSSPWYVLWGGNTEMQIYISYPFTAQMLYFCVLNRSASLLLLVASHRLKSPSISMLTGLCTSPLKTRGPAENSRVSLPKSASKENHSQLFIKI